MNALFLRDLSQKTHRGLRGRAEVRRSAGGNAQGYKVVQGMGPAGLTATEARRIDPAQARVVTRIFRASTASGSPRVLNAAAITGPYGSAWSANNRRGNRGRGTHILNYEQYVGRLVEYRLVAGGVGHWPVIREA